MLKPHNPNGLKPLIKLAETVICICCQKSPLAEFLVKAVLLFWQTIVARKLVVVSTWEEMEVWLLEVIGNDLLNHPGTIPTSDHFSFFFVSLFISRKRVVNSSEVRLVLWLVHPLIVPLDGLQWCFSLHEVNRNLGKKTKDQKTWYSAAQLNVNKLESFPSS